jgi:hypothetical protein
MNRSSLALFTTVYPGAEPYLTAWHASVQGQTDRKFDLWIAVDGLSVESVAAQLGGSPTATWVVANPGDSPAQVRQRALARIIKQYPSVVLVDSDDLLEPTRVAAARQWLRQSDATACAMRLIDAASQNLGVLMGLPSGATVDALLPHHNLFGFSNTAYRSDLLAQCLPIPPDCALVDWFIITRAWAAGARLAFDPACQMAYRRHPANTAPLLPPFNRSEIVTATSLVQSHYDLTLRHFNGRSLACRTKIESERKRVAVFAAAMSAPPTRWDAYVRALNQLPPTLLWWSCVAHPQLSDLWKT